MRSILGALRLPHFLALGAVAAVLGSGSLSSWYGLVKAQVGDAQQLTSCLEQRHVNVAALVLTVGEPSALLEGPRGRDGQRAVRAAARDGKIERREANAVIGCVRKVAAR